MSDETKKDQENEVEAHSHKPSHKPLLSEPTEGYEDEVEGHVLRPSHKPSHKP
ncbi:MAG TPA: hypothetical protein VFM43_00735 [Gaiellaceae bacterium]|nr:hypothetical protein [Gaiellaceae bacterium]